MKKITLLLSAVFVLGATSFAGDGKKGGCCSGKKEACVKEGKKEVADKDKAGCKKGETTASAGAASCHATTAKKADKPSGATASASVKK